MQITTPQGDRPQPDLSPWGVPWPSVDDLQRDADTTWAIEMGLADPSAFNVDEADVLLAAESGVATPGELLDALEREVRERHRATGAEYRLIRLLLGQAAADPVPWVGPDPTLDLAWSDSRGRSVAAVRRDRRDLAERAAVAEIATRLRLSEQTVRTRAAHADVLQTRCPDVWNAFAAGSTSERHATESARLATSLPHTAVAPSHIVGAATSTGTVAAPDKAELIANDTDSADGDAGGWGEEVTCCDGGSGNRHPSRWRRSICCSLQAARWTGCVLGVRWERPLPRRPLWRRLVRNGSSSQGAARVTSLRAG